MMVPLFLETPIFQLQNLFQLSHGFGMCFMGFHVVRKDSIPMDAMPT